MHTLGQNLLADKAARLVDRYRPAGNPDFVILRNTRSAHIDGATGQANVVQSKPVLTVGLQQRQIYFSIGLIEHDVVGRLGLIVDDPQRLRLGLVEIAVLAVGAQYVTQLIMTDLEFFSLRQPFRRAINVDRDDVQWLRLGRPARFQDTDLGVVDKRRVIRVHPEIDWRGPVLLPDAETARERLPGMHFLSNDGVRRLRGDAESWRRAQIVIAELNVDVCKCDVGASLYVG